MGVKTCCYETMHLLVAIFEGRHKYMVPKHGVLYYRSDQRACGFCI